MKKIVNRGKGEMMRKSKVVTGVVVAVVVAAVVLLLFLLSSVIGLVL